MKRKMKLQLMGIAMIAVALTLVTAVHLFFDLLQTHVFDDLKSYAHLLNETGALSDIADLEELAKSNTGIRITYMDAKGNVLYDNEASASELSNHAERPEVRQAIKKGEGYSVRRSATLKESTYYYASRMEDGSIIRVAREEKNLISILSAMMLPAILVGVVLIVICIALSELLTRQLIRPLEEMSAKLDSPEFDVSGYDELQPLLVKIRQQHEDILQASRMRRDFTANVSHELKTPLTAISGYAELIENGLVNGKEAADFGKKIHENANRLLKLIEDILQLSELDAGEEADRAFAPVDLCTIAEKTVENLQVSAAQNGIWMTFRGETANVFGDAGLLEELMYNLVSNAIKYNNRGGRVCVSVSVPENGRALLSVKDNGIGIPEKAQERIFERFYRVDKSRSKEKGGTGLGLAICKHIAVLHDAKIIVKSEVSKGTEMQVLFL